MKIQKFILGLILFGTFVFIQNVSADTDKPILNGETVKLEGVVTSTDVSNSTVQFETSDDNQEMTIKHVPNNVIKTINNQKDGFTISYKNTFTIYDEGSHKINNIANNTNNAYVSAYFNDFSSEEINYQKLMFTLIALMIVVAFTPIALMLFNPMRKKHASN